MAILFSFNVTVARKDDIEAHYPGGIGQFWIDWGKKGGLSHCEDDHLVCFSDMGGPWPLYAGLKSLGIDVLGSSESERPEGVIARHAWIDCDFYEIPYFHRYSTVRHSPSYFVRYWLKGTEPGQAVCAISLTGAAKERLLDLERRRPPTKERLSAQTPTP